MRVKRLVPDAKLPVKAHESDLGYDLFSSEDCSLVWGKPHVIHTGIAIEFPPNFGGIIKDRSSMAKLGYTTSGGVIDSEYRGEICVILQTASHGEIKKGQKIAQMVLIPVITDAVEEVPEGEELTVSERGTAGFGSTGE